MSRVWIFTILCLTTFLFLEVSSLLLKINKELNYFKDASYIELKKIEPIHEPIKVQPIIKKKISEVLESEVPKEDIIKESIQDISDRIEDIDIDIDIDPYPYKICYVEFNKCLNRDVFFDYPSKKYPFEEDLEREIVECIVLKKDCPNQGKSLTLKEYDEFFEFYNDLRNQEREQREQREKEEQQYQ